MNSKLQWKVLTDEEGQASFGTSDEFGVPTAPPTTPSTIGWAMESISSWTTAIYHALFESQMKLVTIYHKMLCCKWQCVRGWLTSSIDICEAEAGLEAVASSDVPSEAILSIKSFTTDLHIRISAYEIHCCREIWQALWVHADLLQNTAKWVVRRMYLLHWPLCRISVQKVCPLQRDLVRDNVLPKTIWTSHKFILQMNGN